MNWKLIGKFNYDGFQFRVWDSEMVSFGSATVGINCLATKPRQLAEEIYNEYLDALAWKQTCEGQKRAYNEFNYNNDY